MTSKAKGAKPLPLGDTLRDLALIRASELDLSCFFPSSSGPASAGQTDDTDASVKRSYEFAREARMALKIMNRGDVDQQGGRVENARNDLEDLMKGIGS